MTHIKVKDAPQYVRDSHSKAILNTDRAALDDYYNKREIAKKQKSESEKTLNRIEKIEKDMQEIKELLHKLAAN